MIDPLRTDQSMLKVYALLAEGVAGSRIHEITGLDEGYISRTAKKLVLKNFLVHIKGTKKPKLYEKGENGKQLDKIILDCKLDCYTRGVTKVAKTHSRVNTGKVHHITLKMKVLTEGALKYYKQGRPYRNIQRSWGQVPYKNEFLTVVLERSLKEGGEITFYVHVPDLDLTAEELPNFKRIAKGIVQGVKNFLEKNNGWTFGEIEDTNWQTHLGFDNPALMKGFAQKYSQRSTDGKVVTSNSDGASEMEMDNFSEDPRDIQYGQIILDMPGEVLTLKMTVNELVPIMKQMVEALTLAEQGMEKVAIINGIQLKTEMSKMASNGVPQDPAFADDRSKDKKEDSGGMYR